MTREPHQRLFSTIAATAAKFPAFTRADTLARMKVVRKFVFFSGVFFVLWALCLRGTPMPGTRLEGTVADKAGAAIPAAFVKLFSLDRVRETKADDSGRFEFADVPAGGYDLQVDSPGFKTRTVEGIQVSDKGVGPFSISLEIANGECGRKPTVSFEERSDKANLKGSVIDLEGGPMKGAKLTLKFSESRQARVATSDQRGEFQFFGLQPGKYALGAAYAHYWGSEVADLRITRENLTTLSPIYLFRKDPHKTIVCQ